VKKVFVYTLLVFYLAVQLRPLTAVVQDVLAHTFFKKQHMATIHFENGRYHLHTELGYIADEESGTKEKSPSPLKSNEDLSNQIITELRFSFSNDHVSLPSFYNPHQAVTAGFTGITFPPPKIV